MGRLRGDESGSSGKSGGEQDDDGENGWGGKHMPIPIQESIEVAVPVKAAYTLARGFHDYPEFIDRIEDAERSLQAAK